MATKYVRADGSATWANANGPETNASNCCSLSTAGSNASAGDTVYLSGLGGVFRATLSPSSSGSSGSVITFEGTNSPEISGADLVGTWSVFSGSVYQATLTTEPEQVWMDGAFGDRQTSTGACVNEYDWYWASNVLYVYAPGDPDTEYTSPGVEAAVRTQVVSPKSYHLFDGITFTKSNQRVVNSWDDDNYTVQNCTIEWAWLDGAICSTSTADLSGVIFTGNVIRYCASAGVLFGVNTTGSIDSFSITKNEFYENCGWHQLVTTGEHTWAGAIKFFTESDDCTNCIVSENEVYRNGIAGEGGSNLGNGIWFDQASGSSGNENIISHNLIYDNITNGIFIEISDYCTAHSNLIYDNSTVTGGYPWACAGIRVDSRLALTSNYNKIYNNTIVGGYVGIFCGTTVSQAEGCSLSYNEFKNNIVTGQSEYAIYANDGGDNAGGWGTGNVYENNCLGAEAISISWDGSTYTTYDSWIAASSQTDNNIESDPSFTAAGSDDYTIASNSPCIGEGLILGAGYDDGLLPGSTWPDGVVTGDRDDY